MQCPNCQHANPPQAKFCLDCGVHLALTCLRCGNELPTEAKFCFQCGERVGTEPTRQSRFVSPETYTPSHLASQACTSWYQ